MSLHEHQPLKYVCSIKKFILNRSHYFWDRPRTSINLYVCDAVPVPKPSYKPFKILIFGTFAESFHEISIYSYNDL
jgi:hypothetical protein